MAGAYRRFEIIDQKSQPFYLTKTSIFPPRPASFPQFCFPPLMDDEELNLALDVLPSYLLLPLDPVCEDLVHIETTPFSSSYKRVVQRRRRGVNEIYLQNLCDRVSALESKFERMIEERERKAVERKYTWMAQIGGGSGRVERKYKWMAEISGNVEEKERKKKLGERRRSYKWVAEIKGKDDVDMTYTWKAAIGRDKVKAEKKKKKKGEKGSSSPRIMEIEEPASDHRAVILRQAFARRAGTYRSKGKRQELSPQDAAMMIQMSFRDYLIRRSRAIRALRELAVAKTKLKEIRALFHNFSYRSRVVHDAEERQKFSEKIIVLLLTVDAIEGADLMVRAAKRSMVDELEAMLEVVDPQPAGRSLSLRRRTFDMPSGDIQKEIDEEETASEASS